MWPLNVPSNKQHWERNNSFTDDFWIARNRLFVDFTRTLIHATWYLLLYTCYLIQTSDIYCQIIVWFPICKKSEKWKIHKKVVTNFLEFILYCIVFKTTVLIWRITRFFFRFLKTMHHSQRFFKKNFALFYFIIMGISIPTMQFFPNR